MDKKEKLDILNSRYLILAIKYDETDYAVKTFRRLVDKYSETDDEELYDYLNCFYNILFKFGSDGDTD